MSDESTQSTNSTDTSNAPDDTLDYASDEDEGYFPDAQRARRQARKDEAEKANKPKLASKPQPKSDSEEQRAQKRFIKAKINGREESVDEETLVREYQKSKASDERMAKAAQIEKNTQAFFKQLQEDPNSVLSHPQLGLKKRELALQWLQEQVEEELEDPREREFKSLTQRVKEYEERDFKAKQDAELKEQTERHERAVQEHRERIGSTLQKAMANTNLSKDPEIQTQALRDMAIEYRLAKQSGDHDITPEELAAKVEARYFKSMYAVTESLSGDELLDFFGDKFLDKLRKADIAPHPEETGAG